MREIEPAAAYTLPANRELPRTQIAPIRANPRTFLFARRVAPIARLGGKVGRKVDPTGIRPDRRPIIDLPKVVDMVKASQ